MGDTSAKATGKKLTIKDGCPNCGSAPTVECHVNCPAPRGRRKKKPTLADECPECKALPKVPCAETCSVQRAGVTKKAVLPAIGSEDVQHHHLDKGYEIVEMDRRILGDGNAQNPRWISIEGLQLLTDSIVENGLVEPSIVWNKRLWTDGKPLGMVAGHQRMKVLDKTSKSGRAYLVNVSVIDVDEDKHIEIMIALNNAASQGGWDMALLGTLVKRPGVKQKAIGFDTTALYQMFGATGEALKKGEDTMALSAAMEKANERQVNLKKAFATRDLTSYFLVMVFDSPDTAVAAADCLSVPVTTYGEVGYIDGALYLQSNLDFLATRATDKNSRPEDIGIRCLRLGLEVFAPIKDGDKRVIAEEDRVAALGYATQAVEALTLKS